jgi:hypothetical protein
VVAKLSGDGRRLLWVRNLEIFGSDWGVGLNGLAVGADGTIVLGGYAQDDSGPITAGAFDTHRDDFDGFVLALGGDGAQILWSTYVGGASFDTVQAVAIAPDGTVWATGHTWSDDFPVTADAWQPTNPSPDADQDDDAFVIALDAGGHDLRYGSYLGSFRFDRATAMAVDRDGSVLVTGITFGTDFPTTAGAYQSAIVDESAAFVVKIRSDHRVTSTLLGVKAEGSAIAVDAAGNVYVAGMTRSSRFPTSPDAIDHQCGDEEGTPTSDGFVSELDPELTRLVYSTFIGDVRNESATIAVTPEGRLFIAGYTSSEHFPTSDDALDRTFGGGVDSETGNPLFDGYFAVVSADRASLEYSTFIGGPGSESMSDLALDGSGGVYVIGGLATDDLTTTPGAYDRSFAAETGSGALLHFVVH